MTPNVVYALYMLFCVVAAVIVWRVPALDLRGVGQVVRRPPASLEQDDGAYVSDAERIEADRFEIRHSTPRADLLLLTLVGALAGVGLAALLGWLGPLALSAGDDQAQGWSLFGSRPMERLAQVVGAVCGIAIGLRLIRVFMLLGALVLATALTLLAANFVLNRELFAGIG